MSNLKNNYKEIYIYGLIDPINNSIKYVGWTMDLKLRLLKHTAPSCLKEYNYKNNWIKSLLGLGLKPSMMILEVVDSLNYCEKEREWISFLGRENLTNSTDGGEGSLGCYLTEETIQKIKDNAPHLSGENHPNYGKHFSDEVRQRMSDGHHGELKGRKRSPFSEEYRRKISEAGKKKVFNEEYRAKISKANSGINNGNIIKKEIIMEIVEMLRQGFRTMYISRKVEVGDYIVTKTRKGFYNYIYGINIGREYELLR
jgi:group I intron endonuclease